MGVDPLSRRELWEIVMRLVHDDGLTVVVSTSYLDEAERCEHVVVMHAGQGAGAGHSPTRSPRKADGLCLSSRRRPTESRRARCRPTVPMPDVVDAVPEAGKVRVVRAAGPIDRRPLTARWRTVSAWSRFPARFEDGFMVLFSAVAGERASARS